jgi:hypothetical protein
MLVVITLSSSTTYTFILPLHSLGILWIQDSKLIKATVMPKAEDQPIRLDLIYLISNNEVK